VIQKKASLVDTSVLISLLGLIITNKIKVNLELYNEMIRVYLTPERIAIRVAQRYLIT